MNKLPGFPRPFGDRAVSYSLTNPTINGKKCLMAELTGKMNGPCDVAPDGLRRVPLLEYLNGVLYFSDTANRVQLIYYNADAMSGLKHWRQTIQDALQSVSWKP